MIELENVTKSYPMVDSVVRALRGVTLKIEDGDFVAFMGPSGSGKSTLTQILGLLDVPSSGSYKISEREVEGLDEDHLARLRREEIGFVFQQFNLLPRMSAIDNVSLPLMYSGREIDDKISGQLLEQVGLGDREDHWPSELSGGQQQRVAIARALVNRPRIVIADEPTGNLDSVSEKEIMKVLSELNGRGITLIIVTHEEEIGQQANRIVRLRDGVIVGDERIRPIGVPSAALSSKDLTPSSEEKAKQGIGFLRELFIHANQGFRALAANKIRTALSMLGILIGVAAVVAMLALGRGAQTSIEKQLASLGSNLLVMRPGAMRIGGVSQEAGASTRITLDAVSALRNQISEIKDLAPTVSGRAQIVYMNKNWSTQVQGVMPAYVRMHASVPTEGRMFTDDEELSRARVAVIGQTLVRELFGDKGPIV